MDAEEFLKQERKETELPYIMSFAKEQIIRLLEEYARERNKEDSIICPKANQCAQVTGGLSCPDNVICPL